MDSKTKNYAKCNSKKDTLREYVMRNEVGFQAFGDLVEVANETEKIWRMYQIAQDNGFTSFAEA